MRSSEWRVVGASVPLRTAGRPEDLADDGRVTEQVLLGFCKPVEAGRDDSLERLGKPELVGGAPFQEQLGELLRIERIAACAFQQRLLGLGGQHGSLQELRDEERGLILAERRERERCGIELAAAPAGTPLEQLGPRGRDRQQRHVRNPVDELVHEVEQALVRPVEVLEDDDERPLLGHRFEKAAPGGEGRLPAVVAELGLGREADEGAQLRLDPVRVAGVREDVGDSASQLLLDAVRGVLLDDAGLGLDDLRERPERYAVAIGEAAALAPRDELRVGIGDARQLVHEAALADSGHPDEREQLRRSFVSRALEGIPNDAELALAADQPRARLVGDVHAEAGVCRLCLPHGDRLRLAFRLD